MLELLGHYNHFPSSAENCLVTLQLPKLDVKFPIGKPAPNHSGLPISLNIRHNLSTIWQSTVLD
jgi:hypothetical protein